MLTKRLQRAIEKNRNEFAGIVLRRYPAFVLSARPVMPAEPPVFVFHVARASELVSVFRYLAENDYSTVTADEYADGAGSGVRGMQRTVMVTFDDGHESLYRVAFPLLARYGLKAVAYLVPGMVPERAGEDGPGCGSSLCSWEQIGEMHASGLVDFQSHSMYHHSIAVGPKIVEFVRPGLEMSFVHSDLAPIVRRDGQVAACEKIPYGTPLRRWGARYGSAPALIEGDTVAEACARYVERNGGANFFEQRDWRGRLEAVARDATEGAGGATEYESPEEQRAAILADLVESKEAIESRLAGKTVRHLCMPWFRGSARAARLSAEAGYVTNAWGSLLPGFAAGGGHHSAMPLAVPRLSPYYIRRLPGKGRESLLRVLRRKAWGEV